MKNTLDRLPEDPRGYAVDLEAGTVHVRYPKHETGPLHRTSPTGLLNMQVDHELTACAECTPSKKGKAVKKTPETAVSVGMPFKEYEQAFGDDAPQPGRVMRALIAEDAEEAKGG